MGVVNTVIYGYIYIYIYGWLRKLFARLRAVMPHIAQLYHHIAQLFFSPERAQRRVLFVRSGLWPSTGVVKLREMGGILEEIHDILKEID